MSGRSLDKLAYDPMSDCQARAGREIAERESATRERCHQQEHLTIYITHVEI